MKINYNQKTIYNLELDNETIIKPLKIIYDFLEKILNEGQRIDFPDDLSSLIFINKGLVLDNEKTFQEQNLTDKDFLILIANRPNQKRNKINIETKLLESLTTNTSIQELFYGNSFSDIINNYINNNPAPIVNNINNINNTNNTNDTNNTTNNAAPAPSADESNSNINHSSKNDSNEENVNNENVNDENKKDYSEQLKHLNLMGFYDNSYNIHLLKLFNGDLTKVINTLC